MAKKYFEYPFVLLTRGASTGGDASDTGYGSGQGTPDDPYACSFADWMAVFHVETYGNDNQLTFDDYRQWWINNNLGSLQWEKYNGNVSMTPGEPHP